MDPEAIVDRCAVDGPMDAETVRRRVARVRDANREGDVAVTFAPPSCATMKAYGDCVDMDDRCERIRHPLAYYESALLDARSDDPPRSGT